jgi:undecaprenyl-diphosphatase
MEPLSLLEAAFLGLVEGLTEFIPVSSTAHILLAQKLLGIDSPGNGFEVLIQFGAILAVMVAYASRLWSMLLALPHDPKVRRFVVIVLIAFLPAAVAGVLAHDYILEVLFLSPRLMAVMLILGGFVLLAVDRIKTEPRYTDVMDLPARAAFGIGLFQCLALIPGVSRSGATIVGAILLGADKRSAADFSFFLAMPTMLGAFVWDLYKNHAVLESADITRIAVGFIVAFLSGLVVVNWLVGYVGRKGFGLFAWWRIGVGLVVLAALGLG